MISRRIIRAKILQILYAHFKGDKSFKQSEKELFFNIEKTEELFFYMFLLIIEIADYAEKIIIINKNKNLPTEEDLNPNTRFIDNQVIKTIKENRQLNAVFEKKKLSWVNHQDIIRSLYKEMIASPYYTAYMENKEPSVKADKNFILHLYKDIIINNEIIWNTLEEQSIYWNDDLEFISSVIVGIIQSMKKDQNPDVPIYKENPESKVADMDYAKQLFRKTAVNFSEHKKLIDKHAQNWDIERIAFIDILIMCMAITEIIDFQTIPVNVTFYEYIELAKLYSTENSSVFINGILDKVTEELRLENKIIKKGRGLIEDNT